MDWSKGFSASYVLMTVNPTTWEDEQEYPIIEGSVDSDISADLLVSADVVMDQPIGEKWVRVYLIATQNGGAERVPIFTGLTSEPSRKIKGKTTTYNMSCYSVLKPAADRLVPLGYYAQAGSEGAAVAASLLKECGLRVTYTPGGAYLPMAIIAEAGETYLTMVQRIVNALGWRVKIDGKGRVDICPYDSKVVADFSTSTDMLEPEVTDEQDWYSCPNVLRVTCDNYSVTVKDEDPNSPLSIPRRGREIWKAESVNSVADLGQYALARLKELQSPARSLDYTRRFDPNVMPGDVVRISYPAQDINGVFRVASQSIDLEYGARTKEVAYEA